ncbi:MAG: hypothetical protein ACK4ZM_02375, partial [bacterium]
FMKIFEYFELLIIGLKYYVYNFFLSVTDFFKIPLILNTINYNISIGSFLKFVSLKILIFYEYFFLPPRWITNLEIKKYKIPNAENYTYGETPYITITEILKDLIDLTQTKDYIFIDLGCGVGKTVFITNILFGIQSIGVDNIQIFITKANKIKKILKLSVIFIKSEIIEFLEELSLEKLFLEELQNKIKQDNKKIVFFIAATAFEENFFNHLISRIVSKVKDSIVITISKSISVKKLSLPKYNKVEILKILSKEYFFSWGKSKVYFYQVINEIKNEVDKS